MSRIPVAPLDTVIIGQRRATSGLQRGLDEDRLFPSLVFHGPPGAGKLTTALHVARVLTCRADTGRPCGACASCRRIDGHALLHPDVRLVLPEKKSEFDKAAPEEETRSGIDPQALQEDSVRNPVWSVLIDRVRQGIAFLHRRPAESAHAVLIIDQAHRMEAAAANALLKTLEEPPAHAVIVLLSPSWHALLPTIRSRCRPVPFGLVARRSIVTWLVENRAMGAEESVLRAGLSGGRVGAAVDLDLEAFRGRRDALVALLEEMARRGDAGVAVARAETLVQTGDDLDSDLEILMTLLRDLLILGASPGDEAALVNVDIVPRLRQLVPALGPRAGTLVEALAAALEAIRHKGNRQLIVENFLMDLVPASAVPRNGGAASAAARG